MFWDNLSFPIVGLSPMDGVTDAPMRFIAKKYGKPDIIYTEFVSAEGLWRIKKRGETENKIWKDLYYDETERPIIAQLFGSDPDSFFEAAKIVCELGFDGIDINMGCPSPGLEKRGGGAGLMRDMGLAGAVIEATRRGVADWIRTQELKNSRTQDIEIPVSVKTRIGSTKPDEGWWKFLAEQKLPAVAMHGRTFKQLYKGEADWESLLKASEIIRESGSRFLGNGDIQGICHCESRNRAEAIPESEIAASPSAPRNDEFRVELKNGKEFDLTGKVDGILIGREALGNPWALRKVTQPCLPAGRCHCDTQIQGHGATVTLKERLVVVIEHAKKYEEIFKELKESRTQGIKTGGKFQFFPMRKHLASYIRGFEGSTGLRKKLMTAEDAEQVESLINEFLSM